MEKGRGKHILKGWKYAAYIGSIVGVIGIGNQNDLLG